tara:strand:- start:3435 stop:3626 length:192 start_codon:yes stop_codon:yes gene_type:complete
MKTDLNELNFVSKFLKKVRDGVADSQMKKLMKSDPEMAKRTKEYSDANKSYENFLKDKLKSLK